MKNKLFVISVGVICFICGYLLSYGLTRQKIDYLRNRVINGINVAQIHPTMANYRLYKAIFNEISSGDIEMAKCSSGMGAKISRSIIADCLKDQACNDFLGDEIEKRVPDVFEGVASPFEIYDQCPLKIQPGKNPD